jgi:hypothetical protein
MPDQTPQNFKAKDQGDKGSTEKTPEAAKHAGVITDTPNQEIHGRAFARTHAEDKHPSGIMPAVHESFGITGSVSTGDTGRKQRSISDDPHPTRMMTAMTPEVEAETKAEKRAKHEQISQSATLMAIDAKTNPAMQPVALTRAYADELPNTDPQKKKLTDLTRQQAADLSPGMRNHYEQKAHTNSPDGWLSVAGKISQLPMDKQLQVIGSGLMAGIEQYRHDEREKTWGQIIGTVQGTGEVWQGLAKIADFGAACVIGDNKRAGKMGAEFGTALGQTIVGGVRLFQAADQYLFNIGYTGDYAKPFQDVAAVGQKLDQQWSGLPPREQERIKTKLITEIVESGAIGAAGASTIQKASKFTEVLDAVAMQAHELHAVSKPVIKRVVNAVSNAVDELVYPLGDTGMGVKMPIPKDSLKDETKMLMSKADDLGPKRSEGGRSREQMPEKYTPSDRFAPKFRDALERLEPDLKQFLADKNIELKPISRVTDNFPERAANSLAVYSRRENCIYLAEEVLHNGQWVDNFDLDFALRHEIGHAFSHRKLGYQQVSSLDEFAKAFREDAKNVPPGVLHTLGFDLKNLEGIEFAREEVFADLFAWASGCKSKNNYSLLIKTHFPRSFNAIKEP